MTMLTRWNPFREMMDVRDEMDRLFEDAMNMPRLWSRETTTWSLPLDLREKDDAFLVTATLPGINPDDLEITLNNDILTIEGEVQGEELDEGEHYHLRERRYGNFVRRITLPVPVNADDVEANYENGILTLHIPKIEEAKPRRIPVQGQSKMLEGELVGKNN